MLPYTDIIANADRHWTGSLLARLTDPKLPESEREDVVTALQQVERETLKSFRSRCLRNCGVTRRRHSICVKSRQHDDRGDRRGRCGK